MEKAKLDFDIINLKPVEKGSLMKMVKTTKQEQQCNDAITRAAQ
jgi:hypothetical protein